jgi:dTDP-4-amino-4,6-dideoxygalactose transaminase
MSGNLLRHDGPLQLVTKFEREFADYVGAKYALTLTSGTVALHAAVSALGIGPGDEVLVPAYTWIATAAAPALAGAIPVLVDINETLTMDPAAIEAKITKHTKAIMPVHMMNAPCDMDAIMAIAKRHNLLVIEDAAQAVGVRYKGRMCGSFGDIGVYSFNQHKNMTIGEGGAVVTNDKALYNRLMNFHDLGIWARDGYDKTGEPPFIASHSRVTEVQGAMLRVQLQRMRSNMQAIQRRVRLIRNAIESQGAVHLSPHNDPGDAYTVTVTFDTEAEAIAYSHRPGVARLYDNTKHIYTNWDPIINKRTSHPQMNPWLWANREITYDQDSCARTLDILRRTCKLHISARWPLPAIWWRARAWAAPVEVTSPAA